MRRPALAAAALVGLAVAAHGPCASARGVTGPGRPVPAPPGRTDAELAEKAARIGRRMPAHVSPEGVLVYEHTLGADATRLSHEALALSDAAIWTGCYVAAEACRWKVTRDPGALESLRALTRGLALMSAASGREGGIVRNVGRPIPGLPPGERTEPSPLGQGYWCRGDPSRDQLSGVVLGWTAVGLFVEDAALKDLARAQLAALARRLTSDRMWLRDLRGRRTEYGELRKDVEGLPFVRNGRLACIGLAPFLAAHALDPAPDLAAAVDRMLRDGWGTALSEQFTWLSAIQDPSDLNQTMLSLLACRWAGKGNAGGRALKGMARVRAATVGWWNGGLIACALAGGLQGGRREALDELRAVLHLMSEEEVPPARVALRERRSIPTVVQRGNNHWTWKDALGSFRETLSPPGERSTTTYTRADWLFAYWLARAAGELSPSPPAGR